MGAYKETVEGDIRRAVELRRRLPSWDESVIWERDDLGRLKNLFPTVAEVWEFCSTARGMVVSCDVETSGDHPLQSQLLCVGFAREDGRAICVPWLKQGGIPYWTEGDQKRIWEVLRWFFAGGFGGAASPSFAFHNGPFDSVVLCIYGWDCFDHWKHDTMQVLHVLDSELPMGLDYLASRRTEIVYYKDAVKGDVRWIDMDDVQLRSYNLRDVLCTVRPLPGLLRDLKSAGENQLALYYHEIELAKEMARATIRGIFVDQWRKYRYAMKLQSDAAKNLEILQAIAGAREFNPGSLEHLRWVLFDRLGFPVLKRTEKGAPSTDKDSMVLLALYAQTKEQIGFLQALVSWRKAAKLSSTWVGIWDGPEWRGEEKITGQNKDGSPKKEILPIEAQPSGQWTKGIPVLNDGRIHPSWSLRTKTGRFSSSPNAQNWTMALKKIFCAEPGNELVGMDLAQAELRGIAYYANDQDLLYMYQERINVHTANCSLLFHVRCPNTKDTNEATERYLSEAIPRLIGLRYEDFPVAQAGQWKGQRTLAKNFVFGCVKRGTRVAVLDSRGGVPIEETKPGDWTWCWDGEAYAPTKIKHVVCHGTAQLVRLHLSAGDGKRKTIDVTPDHPMLTRDGRYVAAGALRSGDRLMPFRRYKMEIGYREIDPRNDGGRAYEHRHVIGPADAAHHENGIKDDNRPENLRALSHLEHRAEHQRVVSAEERDGMSIRAKALWTPAREAMLAEARRKSDRFLEHASALGRTYAAQAREAHRRKAAAKSCSACGGKPHFARGLCQRCYNRDYRNRLPNHVVERIEWLNGPAEVWDLEVEHAAHNFALEGSVFVGNCNYGAEAQTLYEVIRAKRDPDTDRLLFPNIQLDQIEACRVMWTQTQTAHPAWW
jgi:DNA polymerase I-like protein with 3'-5' exonuclease and polymerase domains